MRSPHRGFAIIDLSGPLAQPLPRSHHAASQRCSGVEARQRFIPAFGRQHDNRAIDAGISIALQALRILRGREDAHGHIVGIASRLGGHLPEAGQNIECIEAAAADRHPTIAVGNRAACAVREFAADKDRRDAASAWDRALASRPQGPSNVRSTMNGDVAAPSNRAIAVLASMRDGRGSHRQRRRCVRNLPRHSASCGILALTLVGMAPRMRMRRATRVRNAIGIRDGQPPLRKSRVATFLADVDRVAFDHQADAGRQMRLMRLVTTAAAVSAMNGSSVCLVDVRKVGSARPR